MENGLTSVIIPTYNRVSYLREAIESVLAQTYPDFEIIVVDDGSTDETQEIVRGYGRKVRYIYQENRGPASARNRGIEEAGGEFVAFLDSDDRWTPEKLEKTIKAYREDDQAGFIFTDVLFEDPNGKVLKRTNSGRFGREEIRRRLLEKCVIFVSSVTVRRAVFSEIGYFDETLTYGEDWELFYRIVREKEIRGIGEPLTICRVLPASMMREEKKGKIIRDVHTVFERIYACEENAGGDNRKRKSYARYLREIGGDCLSTGDIQEARRYLRMSMQLRPYSPRAYNLYSKTFLRKFRIYRFLREGKRVLREGAGGLISWREGRDKKGKC